MTTLFSLPGDRGGGMTPRPYQTEALMALDYHMRAKETNPCVVIPTGGGKSILMAWAIATWKTDYPPFRVCVLAHRKELVQQNAEEMHSVWPGGDVGIYSAGLRQRETEPSVLFASIDSVYNRWGEFPAFDCLIVDEAHRIPARGEGKYRQFINGCKSLNQHVKTIGFTATPFRMGCGPICHKDHILHEVCYEANVAALINDGYLCKLRSKLGDAQPDLANVRRNSGGDYITSSLAEAVDIPELVQRAVASMVGHFSRENRQSIVVFCVDVAHCREVSLELRKHGIEAPAITGNTPAMERDRVVEDFKAGRIRAICNCNVYTEGFNAKQVDCIVLLRPTLSKGLYAQMVGRGLRVHPNKTDCLILDYAHCIESHGPIDQLRAGTVKMALCKDCGDVFSKAVRTCPHCGWTIPKQEIEREAAEERKRAEHAAEAAQRAILGSQPEEYKVDNVTVHRHCKDGKPDSLRVEYRCGLSVFREWICLEHGGYAEDKARKWWAFRFGTEAARKISVDDALADMFVEDHLLQKTESVTIVRNGKHDEIISHKLRGL